MNVILKSNKRGELLVLYDETKKFLAIQWLDNKVVSCKSTLYERGLVPVQRRRGTENLQLSVDIALKHYQEVLIMETNIVKWELDLHQVSLQKMEQTSDFLAFVIL